MQLVNHISFVDSPGHQQFITTMLSGAKCMDGAILLVASNEQCPQPQTKEHIAAIEIMKIPHSIIIQNKIDLIDQGQAQINYQEIRNAVKGTISENATIIPISAQMGLNIDVVNQYICTKIPIPVRDLVSPAIMNIVRSFDINKPGCPIDYLRGGVLGGTISKGVLHIGDTIEIRPGLTKYDDISKQFICKPILSTIVSLQCEQTSLEKAYPGGLIGVGLNLDPTLSIADRLVGQVLGFPGHMPDISQQLEIEYNLMRRIIGLEDTDKTKTKISSLVEGEYLQLSIETSTVPAKIKKIRDNKFLVKLGLPVCVSIGHQVCISRKIDNNYRIIGTGIVTKYKPIEL
jgi:translation initiation factor 2 subunit 3